MDKNIKYIDVDKLVPHPKNPRLDVGDVSELANSIKKNGVLQPLTVVPFSGVGDGRYTVIIGHRRLAAAKLAGVKQVLCRIAEMDDREQIETMLIENMQRRQLTPYEEAEGFQLMFDFGDDVKTVADRTGFSETTVRNRMKLLRLDKETFKESQSREINLNDYLAAAALEDEDARNEVLKAAGTNNFDWILRRERDNEKKRRNRAELIRQLETFAERIDTEAEDYDENYWNEYFHEQFYGFTEPIEIDVQEYLNDRDAKYFFEESGGMVYIYRIGPADEEEADEEEADEEEADEPTPEEIEAEKKRKELAERKEKLDEIKERGYNLRREFVKSFTPKTETERVIIARYALSAADMYIYNFRLICELLELNDEISDEMPKNIVIGFAEVSAANTFRVILALAWLKTDGEWKTAHLHNGQYNNDGAKELHRVYNFLKSLGYEMSDEEKAYINGTHELFEGDATI